jgi:FdhD protein
MTDLRPGPSTRVRVNVVEDGRIQTRADLLATEEPMEIRVVGAGGQRRTVAITMRTPGRDFELAAGFLFAEGVVAGRADIERIDYCTDSHLTEDERRNVVTVTLAGPIPALPSIDRRFLTTSACGVCGKESLEALRIRGCGPVPAGPTVEPEVLCSLPDRLRASQVVFAKTGGLHAAGLFAPTGELLAVREDVGRHNAVDKIAGWALLADKLPANQCILMISGRASYEIMQKAVVAGIPFVAAVSAPSSLAVALGRDFGMTLVGFVRGRRFNLYAGEQRIAAGP